MDALQIKHLGANNEVRNCINCFAGQVTVLRARSESDRKMFQRALLALPGPERFALSLNNQEFQPRDHFYIGFGEKFGERDNTVAHFLEKSKVPLQHASTLLLMYELEGLHETLCIDLNPCQQRRLRLLCGLHSVGTPLVVISEPFEDMTLVSSKDLIAAHFLRQPVLQDRIILITSTIQYTPQLWVNSEKVVFATIKMDRQLTVGFGMENDEMKQILAQVRGILKDPDQADAFLAANPAMKEALEEEEAPSQPPTPPTATQVKATAVAEKVLKGAVSKNMPGGGKLIDKEFLDLVHSDVIDLTATEPPPPPPPSTLERCRRAWKVAKEAFATENEIEEDFHQRYYEHNSISVKSVMQPMQRTPQWKQYLIPFAIGALVAGIGIPVISKFMPASRVVIVEVPAQESEIAPQSKEDNRRRRPAVSGAATRTP